MLISFFAGLLLLVAGAELLVRGASRIAAFIGISPLIIGLTVVAFGTSSPEMAVSVKSSLAGNSDIALGNIVGSNIFNILFILGASAMITPLLVSQQLVRLDVPIMIIVSFAVLVFGIDLVFARAEGIILLAGIVAYTVFLIFQAKKEKNSAVIKEYETEFADKDHKSPKYIVFHVVLVFGGLYLLIMGSKWLVDSAVLMAGYFGVSNIIISLTIVAAGTSLPEVFTSIIASIKGERDIAVGNIIGSNIFNILAVLGLSSIFAPSGIIINPHTFNFDVPIMIAVTVACLPIFITGNVISRWEGCLFFTYYIAYTIYIILSVTKNASLDLFRTAMIYFVIPLTVVTILISISRIKCSKNSQSF